MKSVLKLFKSSDELKEFPSFSKTLKDVKEANAKELAEASKRLPKVRKKIQESIERLIKQNYRHWSRRSTELDDLFDMRLSEETQLNIIAHLKAELLMAGYKVSMEERHKEDLVIQLRD